MLKYDDIELAFDFISGAPQCANQVFYDKRNGQLYYSSGMGDMDEVPEDANDDDLIEIPHRNDLDLGQALVFQFIRKVLPDQYPEVKRIFSRSGAYGRFKSFLQRRGQLEAWYLYEDAATRQALLQWCHNNNIPITPPPA